jgi:hypothetical protein
VASPYVRDAVSTATFGAGRSYYQYQGLKPLAQSYHPFGIKNLPDTSVRKSARPVVRFYVERLKDIQSRFAVMRGNLV